MKTHGYISLHRQLLDWQFHNNPSMLTVWMHLLLLAEYEPTECDGVQLERGELLVSQLWLAEFVGISISQLRSCLKHLEETGCITRNITRHLTRIKILHFNDYQQSTATQPTKNNETFNEKKHDIGISINNKKTLSEREGRKDPTPPKGQRKENILQLLKTDYWKEKCCRDYCIPANDINRHIIAFNEFLSIESPSKNWLSFDDFCRHFYAWLRYQQPEDINRFAAIYLRRLQQHRNREIEEQRQAQLHREIEEAKRNAITYEEYQRRKEASSTEQQP